MLLNHTSHLGDYDEAIFTSPEASRRCGSGTHPGAARRLGLEEPSGTPGDLGRLLELNYIVLDAARGHRHADRRCVTGT